MDAPGRNPDDGRAGWDGPRQDGRKSSGRSEAVVDLRVTLGRLALDNPVLVASGTFGYIREMEEFATLPNFLGGWQSTRRP